MTRRLGNCTEHWASSADRARNGRWSQVRFQPRRGRSRTRTAARRTGCDHGVLHQSDRPRRYGPRAAGGPTARPARRT
eukprot:10299343-Alexandrium_andersonii.AAC.1